MNNTGKL